MSTLETVQAKNAELIDLIKRVEVDTSYCYNPEKLLDEKIGAIVQKAKTVLDFGKSSRHRYDLFAEGQIETADINDFGDYPDHICDICDISTFPDKTYDAIICNAVIEHVYDPAQAVKNMYVALNENGTCLCYAPFVFRYHAHESLKYQDYFRFTRDGLAYLFRDFSSVTLYSIRGKTSSAISLAYPGWKDRIESRSQVLSKFFDRLFGGYRDPYQTSGYVIWAVK